jgi:hypothetical protein
MSIQRLAINDGSISAWTTCLRLSLKAQKKPSKHERRYVPHVVTVLKLAEVLGQMLSRNVNVRPEDRALEVAPEAFQAVRVMDAVNPLLSGVRDDAVLVAAIGEVPIGRPFVAADRRAGLDLLDDDRLKRLAPHVRYDAGHHVAVPLQHPEYDCLAFNVARQIAVAVNLGHVLADFVPDAPSRLVGHAELALQFLRRDTVPGRGKEVHRVEPLLQRRPAILERRPRHRVDVMAAPRARVSRHLRQLCKAPVPLALRAIQRLAVAYLHQVREAAIVVWETPKEILNRELFGLLIPT